MGRGARDRRPLLIWKKSRIEETDAKIKTGNKQLFQERGLRIAQTSLRVTYDHP
ncbi:hypothetical protein HPP92_006566 [Vanilla planifolia]|uniref:Uncharacterized protein n=1 Tax=Vanilla planifolia TaxID=51239 RepID=A0A835RFV6_VANPL|nr:hypothetical protein HPP92_006825 [Vanilla planifolia]KAG0489703.1 hypothetical protein HPP92_006566 [Vanilla planifolia]